jgi:hypothetical protein
MVRVLSTVLLLTAMATQAVFAHQGEIITSAEVDVSASFDFGIGFHFGSGGFDFGLDAHLSVKDYAEKCFHGLVWKLDGQDVCKGSSPWTVVDGYKQCNCGQSGYLMRYKEDQFHHNGKVTLGFLAEYDFELEVFVEGKWTATKLEKPNKIDQVKAKKCTYEYEKKFVC